MSLNSCFIKLIRAALFTLLSHFFQLPLVFGELECTSAHHKSWSSTCIYKNTTCCDSFNGDRCLREMTGRDVAPPEVRFREQSLFIDHGMDRICINGLMPKNVRGEKWSLLKGLKVEVSIEDTTSGFLIGSHMAEFMFTNENREANGGPDLEKLLMCFPMGTAETIQKLRLYHSVFFWLVMVPLPPSLHSHPVQYPGNPVQLSTLPVKHMQVDPWTCKLLTLEAFNDSEAVFHHPTSPEDREKSLWRTLAVVSAIALGVIALATIILVALVCLGCKRFKKSSESSGRLICQGEEREEENSELRVDIEGVKTIFKSANSESGIKTTES